jgi:alpha-1,3-rhamnosyl/mannosyltransferase
MRVALNLLWLRPGEVGGTESYATRLATALAGMTTEDRPDLTLFALPPFATAYPDLVARVPTHVSPAPGRPKWLRVLAEATWLPALTKGFDIVHHLGGTVPVVSRKPAIVTIHDLQYLDLPQFFSSGKRAYLGLTVPRSARQAKVVATVSEFARLGIIEHLGVSPDKVVVVPHALPPPPPAPAPDAVPPGTPEQFVLLPAIAYPHKNHTVVIDALARVADLHLVCTGLPWSEDAALRARAERLGVSGRLHQLGLVSPTTLEALYRRAAALVFPSRYEGFGAPVIEAMQRDCPVLAADATALREVVGDGGVLLPVDDPAAWAAAIERVVADPAWRAALVERGRQRAAAFRPEVAARAQAAAYDLALQP